MEINITDNNNKPFFDHRRPGAGETPEMRKVVVGGRSLTLGAVLQLPDGAHGAQAGGNGASHDAGGDGAAGGPVRGKMLGKVTVNL